MITIIITNLDIVKLTNDVISLCAQSIYSINSILKKNTVCLICIQHSNTILCENDIFTTYSDIYSPRDLGHYSTLDLYNSCNVYQPHRGETTLIINLCTTLRLLFFLFDKNRMRQLLHLVSRKLTWVPIYVVTLSGCVLYCTGMVCLCNDHYNYIFICWAKQNYIYLFLIMTSHKFSPCDLTCQFVHSKYSKRSITH